MLDEQLRIKQKLCNISGLGRKMHDALEIQIVTECEVSQLF